MIKLKSIELKFAFDKYYNGDRLTNEELDAIIEFVHEMVEHSWVLPDKFNLFITALRKVYQDCLSFKLSRARNENQGIKIVFGKSTQEHEGPPDPSVKVAKVK